MSNASVTAEEAFEIDQEIVNLLYVDEKALPVVNALANLLYAMDDFNPKESGYNFAESTDVFEQSCFQKASVAFNFSEKMRT